MQEITIKEILDATGGNLLCGDVCCKVTSVVTNSKEVRKGALFVPIKGEKVDGHQFIPVAFSEGATAAFSENKEITDDTKALIFVSNTRDALQSLAAYYRNQFEIPVIGVTGSVGKTSTKEMIAAALSEGGSVMKTAGNQNSQIGLPLTIFQLEKQHDMAVIEMGISEFSEMERLAKVAKVNRAVVTNIGVSHIENLKTKENIRDQKLHIIDYFNKGDTLYLNGSDPLLSSLRGRLSVPVVFYGLEEFCDYRAKNIETHEAFTSFILESKRYSGPVTIPAIGVHHVFNALAAIAVAFDVGLSIDQIKKGLLTYQTLAMRQQVHRLKRFTVIDDSYNASPDSIKSGVGVLKAVQRGKRSIAVLGDMLELGEQSQKEHFSLGEYLAKEKIDVVITVGEQAAQIVEGAKKNSEQIVAKSCASREDAFDLLKKVIKEGDTILVKGSRGMHMDEVVKNLIALG